jgi:folate-binding protein YgfZ
MGTSSESAIGSPGVVRGRDVIAREYEALKAGAGFSVLDDRLVIRMSGDDRVPFLHGMCTADIKGMAFERVAPGLFVTERAHVIRDFYVYALADALLLETDRDAWPTVRAHLEKFLVADDVELGEQPDLTIIDCQGPASATRLAESGLLTTPLVPWTLATPEMIAHLPRLGRPAFSLLVDRAATAELLLRLVAAGLTEVGVEAREIMRVEQGLARVGVDTNQRTLALEARYEPAISFNKGCYIGQETIERATARGGIKRRLCGLKVEGGKAPARGASILLADKPVGTLTSIADSPANGLIGLAILHHSAWADGTVVTLTDSAEPSSAGVIMARVTGLPFTAE